MIETDNTRRHANFGFAAEIGFAFRRNSKVESKW